ncbi:mechanosensitive ion channel [Pontibacter sp. JH31]|uniref:Mechanosensitive ion channel n=1 Tax=Pontibacter aquaedesilientis TaxID=2766980 RepID=A0ABR7XD00_9BACT|nr:mechanosensitive ion channel domain-containing protein [Pontibacter aquaedesilientis]MBD1396169.1 mechanosensitive ion channel [Pontibacter aquaedesilientis]
MQGSSFTQETRNLSLSAQDILGAQYDKLVLLLPELLVAVVLLLLFIFVAGKLSLLVQNKLGKRVDDPLLVSFVSNVTRWGLILVGFMLMLQIVGLTGIAGGLLAGAGLSAFVVGFALKDIAENFLAGIILAFNRPFRVEDTVQVRDFIGKILALNLRSTQMKTFDGKDIYIPNSILLKEVVTNYTRDGLLRIEFLIKIDYQHDFETVAAIIVKNVEQLEGVLKEDKPAVVIEEFTNSGMSLRVLFWVQSFDYKLSTMQLKSKAMDAIKKSLWSNGISLSAK